MELPELDLLSSELRNNPLAFLTLKTQNTDMDELENQDILCLAYKNGRVDKKKLLEEIEKENFEYPVSLFDENIKYKNDEELFKEIASRDVDDGEGNLKPESQENDDDY